MPPFSSALATLRPHEHALVDGARTFGWAEIDAILNRVANQVLAADLGPEDRVAVFAENAAETALAHLGCLLGGASTVPVNFHLTAAETAYILEDSGTRILFVVEETADRGIEAARLAGVQTVICWGCQARTDLQSWDSWLAAGDSACWCPRRLVALDSFRQLTL